MALSRVSAGDKVISPLVLANDLRLLAKNETIATPFQLPGLSGFLQGLCDGFVQSGNNCVSGYKILVRLRTCGMTKIGAFIRSDKVTASLGRASTSWVLPPLTGSIRFA